MCPFVSFTTDTLPYFRYTQLGVLCSSVVGRVRSMGLCTDDTSMYRPQRPKLAEHGCISVLNYNEDSAMVDPAMSLFKAPAERHGVLHRDCVIW